MGLQAYLHDPRIKACEYQGLKAYLRESRDAVRDDRTPRASSPTPTPITRRPTPPPALASLQSGGCERNSAQRRCRRGEVHGRSLPPSAFTGVDVLPESCARRAGSAGNAGIVALLCSRDRVPIDARCAPIATLQSREPVPTDGRRVPIDHDRCVSALDGCESRLGRKLAAAGSTLPPNDGIA